MTADSPERALALPSGRQELKVIPYPQRRTDLATLTDVRREAARIYRDVRLKKLESAEGSRLVYMLSTVGKLIEAADVQTRIDALERAMGRRV